MNKHHIDSETWPSLFTEQTTLLGNQEKWISGEYTVRGQRTWCRGTL